MSAIFGWQNLVTNAAITALSSETTMGPTNIIGPHGASSTAWQTKAGVTTIATGAQIDIQPAVLAQTWRIIGIFGCNLTSSASVTIRLGNTYASPSFVSTTVVNGPVAGYRQIVLVLPANVTADFLRIGFDDSANPDTHINVPLVFAGPAFIATRGLSWSSTTGRDEATIETTSRGGQEYPMLLWQRRRWELQFDALSASEIWTQVDPLVVASRAGGNVFFAPDHAGAYLQQEAIFGRIKTISDFSYPFHNIDRRHWQATMTERL